MAEFFEVMKQARRKWAAENPEVRYPTWREWQQANFPNNSSPIHPCEFMRRSDMYCFNFLGLGGCGACANQPIPANVAKKLGIQPITKVNNTTTKEVSQ